MMRKQEMVAAALVAGVAFGACAAPAMAADKVTINFVSWGGAYAKSQIKAMIEPYQQQNPDVKINVIDYNGGLAQIKAQIEAKNVVWQIVDMTPQRGVAGCDEGILEAIDTSKLAPADDGTPATEDFVEGSLLECFIGNISWATVVAYNTEKVKGAPASVADFWDTAKYPGRRGLRKVPEVNIEWALEADGVPRDKIYEVLEADGGVERAFKSLDKIKAQVVWWEAGAQPPQLLADGEVAFSSAYNGRLYNAITVEKQPIVIAWDTQVYDLDGFVIPKGAPNQDAVMDFLAFATSGKVLADSTRYISYGPVRKSSTPHIAADILPHLPTAPQNFKNALQYNTDWWADRVTEMSERFNAWLAQ